MLTRMIKWAELQTLLNRVINKLLIIFNHYYYCVENESNQFIDYFESQ